MTFDAGQEGHVTEHNRLASAFVLSSRYTSIAAAITALPSSGGTVIVPPGDHILSAPIETSQPNLRIVGSGAPGQGGSVGDGATRIHCPDGDWGFIFAEQTASCVFRGPTLENLHFLPASGATPSGGIWIDNASNARIINCTVSDMTSGVGIRFGSHSAATTAAQYHEMWGVIVAECLTGIDLYDANGVRMHGGFIEYMGGGTPTAGSVGIKIRNGGAASFHRSDSFRAFGTVVQFQDVGIEINADAAELHGCRFEACNVGVDVLALGRDCNIFGGSFTNSIIGSGGVGIRIADGVTKVGIHAPTITAVATQIDDNRSSAPTAKIDEGGGVQALGDLMLQSPNGTWFTVAVANDGTLSASS